MAHASGRDDTVPCGGAAATCVSPPEAAAPAPAAPGRTSPRPAGSRPGDAAGTTSADTAAPLVQSVRESMVGANATFQSPFGPRRLVYLDYTASGRSVGFIEDYIRTEVLPSYGNCHTLGSHCGLQATSFREEARQIVHDCVHGTDKDVALFTGSGTTAGVCQLVHQLGVADRVHAVRLHAATPRAVDRDGSGGDGGPHRGATEWQWLCTFPGCGRRFPDGAALKLHQHTHNDGHFHADSVLAATQVVVTPPTLPVVFCGPYAHHSSILPWKETGADVVMVPEDHDVGGVDMRALKAALGAYADRDTKIGAFTAASNVTGARVDVAAVTRLLHQHDALAVWDYAAAAPHSAIDMNPPDPTHAPLRPDGTSMLSLDAVVFSPHKFCGGPGTPGILVVKRRLLRNKTPSRPGGGTVFFVRRDGTPVYAPDDAMREEGGTPDIVGAIRAGLVMQLHRSIGVDVVEKLEGGMAAEARRRWAAHANIMVMGRSGQPCVPIISVAVCHRGRLLHWGFVVALLNDLFGIQSRGGCLCAGPYSQDLLGLSSTDSSDLERQLLDRSEMLRPGFVRISFPFHITRDDFEFCVTAMEWVADHGALLLPLYTPLTDTGEWRHISVGKRPPPRKWLQSVSFETGRMTYSSQNVALPSFATPGAPPSAADTFAAANELLRDLARGDDGAFRGTAPKSVPDVTGLLPPAAHPLRWFTIAADVYEGAATPPPAFLSHMQAVPRDDSRSSVAPAAAAAAGCGTGAGSVGVARDDGGRVSLPPEAGGDGVDGDGVDGDDHGADLLLGIGVEAADGDGDATVPPPPFKPPRLKTFPYALRHPVQQALSTFNMIRDGDRLLLGLSGGKDSLSLLHFLLSYQRQSKVSFDLAACTVDPQAPGYDPCPLRGHLERLDVPYFIESQAVLKRAESRMSGPSICSWCARMKRGILYAACRREGYNVLVLGQHLDDVAESYFMSVFYNGTACTMKAHYMNEAGDVRIIRPLVFVRERTLREFASSAGLPVLDENCPACFSVPQERYRMKTLLSAQEHINPDVFSSIRRALLPAMAVGAPDADGAMPAVAGAAADMDDVDNACGGGMCAR